MIITYNGTDINIYINGEYKGSPPTTDITRSDGDYNLGRFKNPNNPCWFQGALDEIKIFDRGLRTNDIAIVHTDGPPRVPTGLEAIPGDSLVDLSWHPNPEPDIASYEIHRLEPPLFFSILDTIPFTTLTYSDHDVTPGDTYYYYVSAIDTDSNKSALSSEVYATPFDITPPPPPLNLTASAVNMTVELSWIPSEPDLAGYNIYRSTTSGQDYTKLNTNSLITTPAYTDLNIEPNTLYYYVVTAVDSFSNQSAYSSEVSALTPNTEPLPEGSFGEQYQDLIPPDATIETYDPKRFSIITGLVQDKTKTPLPETTISIHNHPEYGTVHTDTQGRFSIPIDGGGTTTIICQKTGLITTHRKLVVPWNDIAIAETITMIPEDTIATTVTFDGNPSTIITHKSSAITDEHGTRSLTMIFSGDNRAFTTDANGNETELTTITTRATEFDTPQSMPAKLPPTSAYTYCAELSVDGTKNVRFEKPIVTYVNNFLGFDIGEIVPVGYYDRDRAVWVPSDNGIVVRLLDTDNNGIVDALDSTGDGQPDDLNNNGSYNDEVSGLHNPAQYQPDTTYWRVEISHFTPWDCNWPYGPPLDAIAPNPEGEPNLDQQQKEDDINCINSFVERRSRIFHEDIPVPGTDMTLHYASSRVKGYKPSVITIPASGQTVPASLKQIVVKMELAGRQFESLLEPLPNQKVNYIWDGLDYLERPIVGSKIAHISIGFVYNAVYYSSAEDRTASFAQTGIRPTRIQARQEIIRWKRNEVVIHRQKRGERGVGTVAEGWTISPHHYLSPSDHSILYKGNGTTNKNNTIKIINTVAGGGSSGDGGPATEAWLFWPDGVAVDSAGNIYIADTWNHRIRKVDTNGDITTVAGSGPTGYGGGGYSGDGGPATEARLNYPTGVAVDNAGNIYIADELNHRIRKVDTNGIITTVAGNGDYGYNGDGIPATEASLWDPYGVAVDNAGNIYIADSYDGPYTFGRIRKVDTNGIITTVAGNGEVGYSGDGGPAIEASLGYISDVSVDNTGNIYITDTYRIRKVDTSGIITTVAGGGSGGDGGPATEASLKRPSGAVVDNVGNIYIADAYDNRIRKVDTSGIITTVAGGGSGGDGGPATEASLHTPYGVAVDNAGNIYIADTLNHRIRKVSPPSAFIGAIDIGDITFTDENGLGYILDSTGLHKSTIDLSTGKTILTFGYNPDNQLISITDRFDNQTTIQRDASGVPISITSPDNILTHLTIDENNHLTNVTSPDDTYYSFTYTTDGLMTHEYDPDNNHFEHWYDENGRLTDLFDPEGGSWNYSREVDNKSNILVSILTGEGNLTTYEDHTDSTGAYTSAKTDPAGAVTFISRSPDGLSETRELPCGMNLTLKYDLDSEYKFKYLKESTTTSPQGLSRIITNTKTYEDTNTDDIPDLITDTVTVNSRDWTMTNNTLTGLITYTSPLARTLTLQYNTSNLLTQEINIPGLFPVTFSYDTRGRLETAAAGDRAVTIAYDNNGNIDYIITPDNQTFDYTFDIMGRLRYETRPDATPIQYDYDNNGNMTILTNPMNINHTFDYTANDRRKTYLTPLSGSYIYAYDKERNLKTLTFPSGKLITNTYTNGLLTDMQTPEGLIHFTYDCLKITGAVKGTESLSYTYDGSLLTSVTSSGLVNQTIGYSFNNDFRLSSVTYSGATDTFIYDNDGLLTTIGSYTIARNSLNGLPESVTDNTLTLSRGFSNYGEIDDNAYSIGATNIYNWTVTQRDLAGRIKQRVEDIGTSTITWDYIYDAIGRLKQVKKDGSIVESYTYDFNGNMETETNTLRGIYDRVFTYSEEDYILTAGDDVYQFDKDGFLKERTTTDGLATFDYSSRGGLLSAGLPDGRVILYEHDPVGRRIVKRVNGTIVEKYFWSGLTRLLAVYDGADNLISRFSYADARMPMSMEMGGNTYYLLYDQVGSLRAVADSAGNIIKRVDYDSFGNIIYDSNPGFSIPFGFAGGLHDRDTGLVRFGARDYDPAIGRWTAKDPIDFAGGDVNLYGYCVSDPVNFIDPDGLVPRWMVPQYLIDNSQAVVNAVTNNAFNQQELVTLTDLVIAEIGFREAFKFKDVTLDSFGNVPLTKKQKEILDSLFNRLLKDEDNIDLIKKAYEEYLKALNENRCYLK